MILSGVLYNAGGPVRLAKIVFIATKTSLNGVLKGAYREFITQEDGTYFLDLEPGYYRVEWYPSKGPVVRLGTVTADDATMATLPEALRADGQPVNPDIVKDEVQQALDQIQTLRDAAEVFASDAAESAASVDAQNIVHAPGSGLDNEAGTAYSYGVGSGSQQLPRNADLGALSRIDALSDAEVGNIDDLRQNLGVDGEGAIASTGYVDEGLQQRVAVGSVGGEEVTTSTGTQTVVEALNRRSVLLTKTRTYEVGVDFSSPWEALAELSKYKLTSSVRVDIIVPDGYEIDQPLVLSGGDFSQYAFVGEGEIGLSAAYNFTNTAVIDAQNTKLPSWGVLLNCNGMAKHGLYLTNHSEIFVLENSGVKSAGINGGSNIFLFGRCSLTGDRQIFSDSLFRGVWLTHNSEAWSRFINASGAENEAALFISRGSKIHADHADVRNSLTGLRNGRSYASIRDSDLRGCGAGLTLSEAGITTASRSDFRECNVGARVFQGGGTLNIERSNMDNIAETCLLLESGAGTICIDKTSFNNTGKIIDNLGSYSISANEISGNNHRGITTGGGVLRANLVNLTNSTVNGLRVQDGAIVQRLTGTISGSQAKDISMVRGSTISATNLTTTSGALSLSDTDVPAFNTVNADGVLYYS